jgi:putative peptidoglycan lipid II flippase
MDAAPAREGERRRMAASAALFSIATGLSRVAGLVREVAAAAVYGIASASINAFSVAFAIPNLVRALVADAALGASFVPIFNELLERGERERAWRVASTVFWLSFAGLSAVTAVFIVLAPDIVGVYGFDDPDTRDLAVRLARVMFPLVVLLGLNGILIAILNSFDEFFVPAIAPVAWNAIIIGAILAAVPLADSEEAKIAFYAGGVLVGTAVQLALPVPWLRGRGGRIGFHLHLRDPAVGRVFANMLPVALGLGLINLSLLVSQWFAVRLDPDLAAAALDKAFRIYMLPQGMFSVAVATVLFPALSRYAARGERERFRETVDLGIRQIAFVLVPSAVACAVLAEPMVRLLYERGEFTSADTPVVAEALAAFSLGLAFNGLILLFNRAFFARQKVWGPTAVALASLLLTGILTLALYRPLGVWGIPLASSLANIATVAVLMPYLRRDIGPIGGPATLAVLARIGLASALLAAVAWPVWRVLDGLIGRSLPAQVAALGSALVLGGGAYVLAARALKVDEADVLRSLVRRGGKG